VIAVHQAPGNLLNRFVSNYGPLFHLFTLSGRRAQLPLRPGVRTTKSKIPPSSSGTHQSPFDKKSIVTIINEEDEDEALTIFRDDEEKAANHGVRSASHLYLNEHALGFSRPHIRRCEKPEYVSASNAALLDASRMEIVSFRAVLSQSSRQSEILCTFRTKFHAGKGNTAGADFACKSPAIFADAQYAIA
jgi:hypothetical protein